MRRMAAVGLLTVGLLTACGGSEPVADAGFGLRCPGGHATGAALSASGEAGQPTPEAAVAVFVTNPIGGPLPAQGWERADVVPTESGAAPTTPVPTTPGGDGGAQAAFVRRRGDRVDHVLLVSQTPSGWVVTGVHQCVD